MMSAKLRIGLLFPEIDNREFMLNSWKDVIRSCKDYGITTISFVVGEIQKEETVKKGSNFLTDLVDKENLDGLICYTNALAIQLGLAAIKRYCEKFKPLPLVDLEPIPNNKFENTGYSGFRMAIAHLIDVHQCKNIAHAPGPLNLPEADFRLLAYIDELESRGIAVNPDLIAPRNTWFEETGIAAVKTFLDDRKVKFDAVVAANDDIAFGVMDELRRRGIRIPESVKVTGFDNFKQGEFEQPPLTSVFVKGFGSYSVEKLLREIGYSVNQSFPHSKLKIRNSCGCLSGMMKSIDVTTDKNENIFHDFEHSKELLTEALSGQFKKMLIKSLINKDETFIVFFDEFFNLVSNENQETKNWQNVISRLENYICQHAESKRMDRIYMLKFFSKLRVKVYEAESRRLQKHEADFSADYKKYQSISEKLNSTYLITQLEKIICESFPVLRIPSCYIVLFEGSTENAKLLIGYNSHGKLDSGKYSVFESRHLVPDGIELDGDHIVYGLYFESEVIGFVVFGTDGMPHFYDQLSNQLSMVIKGVLLVEKMQERTIELERTYNDLKENQQKLLVSEKMASLGRLTAGIAHEMNTPLSTVQSALYQMVNLINEYKMSVGNPDVLPEDHEHIAEDMHKNVKLATQAIERSSGFIRGIKAQTYDMNNNRNEIFTASPIIKDTLAILGFALKKGNCILETDIDENLKISGNPRWLGQIITNLVVNAVDACKPAGGIVRLSLKKNETGVIVLKICDTGVGIPPENISRIFDPMFTTKNFGEGTGLGLSIIHDMINEMKGTIEVLSKPGDTVFIINLPSAEDK